LTGHPLHQDELDYQGDYVYKKVEGREISWKDDEKNLTKSLEIKKKRKKVRVRILLRRECAMVGWRCVCSV